MDSHKAISFIYQSYVAAQPHIKETLDIHRRDPRNTRRLLAALGLDLGQPPSVMVAGSKGKGSTSSLVASILRAAGYKTGLFSGPHLVDFCERIRINGRKIDEPNFVRLVQKAEPAVKAITDSLARDQYLGPVGITLAVALMWYQEQQTQYNVIECGRGGISDDTSALKNQWSVLTPIMFEHPNELGPTVLDIAANKLGIVRPGQQVCVSASQQPEVANLVRSMCRHLGVEVLMEGQDFNVVHKSGSLGGSEFEYNSPHLQGRFSVALAGRYQIQNAGVAITVARQIVPHLDATAVQTGLAAVRWPGRCELLPGQPPVLLDGAINSESAGYLAELIAAISGPLHLVTGVPADKDWQGVISRLAPLAYRVWLTNADNPRLVFPSGSEAVPYARKYASQVEHVPDSYAAIRSALAAAAGLGGTLVVAGTQSLIRDAKVVLGQEEDLE